MRASSLSAFMSVMKGASKSFVISVHMYQLSFQWMDFCEFWFWRLLWKPVYKIKICSKSDKNIVHITWRPQYLHVVGSSAKYFVVWQQGKVNPLLHFYSNTEQLLCWQQRDLAVRRQHIVAFPWQQWLCEHAALLSFTYIAYLVGTH
jgi:hypothetical protein